MFSPKISCAVRPLVGLLTMVWLLAACQKDDAQDRQITVRFDTRGGEPASFEQTVHSGETLTQPDKPTLARHMFRFWCLDPEHPTAFDFHTPITEPITLYAHWMQNAFTITFDARGGEPAPAPISISGTGSFIEAPEPPYKPDSVLTGWYTDEGELYEFGSIIDRDLTLHARYELGYGVSFVSGAPDLEIPDQHIKKGLQATEPDEIPTQRAHLFSGWYIDEACTTPYDFSTPVTSHTTLYAGFTRLIEINTRQLISRVTGASQPDDGAALNPTQTHLYYNVGATDLGIIWEMSPGRVGIFFGDTYGSDYVYTGAGGPGGSDARSNVLAFSDDTNLEDGLAFSGMALDPANPNRAREVIPHMGEGAFTSIPTSAIRVGNTDYVHYMNWEVWGSATDTRNFSSFYRSDDDGATWSACPEVRFPWNTNFFMVALEKKDGYVYMMGTPHGRLGNARLARIAEADIEHMDRYEYWTGHNWVAGDETAAADLITGGAGEASLMWHEKYHLWLYLYCSGDKGIFLGQAARITGPWHITQISSGTQNLAPGLGWGAYGSFMHKSFNDGDRLYFISSTWQHYNTFLIGADIHPVE